MSPPPPRVARLVLVRRTGGPIGALPPFPVDTPWWMETEPVVRAARDRHGVTVTILRLLESERPAPHGGAVTYLAETDAEPAEIEPWDGDLDDHPLRQSWARPGGPDADLAWADAVLSRHGLRRDGSAVQVRSWNLSSLWRLPLRDGSSAWLKVVPPFFDHEGSMLERLAGGPVPSLLGRDGPRVLMPEIPGDDLYDAGLPILVRLVTSLVEVQAGCAARVEELFALGLPDWRGGALTRAVADVVDRTADELGADDRRTLGAFVDGLARRFDRLAETGIPDSLVHGDFHPGNARGRGSEVTLLDWGDSGVGHPLLDQPAFLDRIPGGAVEPIRDVWARAWRSAVPGSDPDRAAALLAPVAAARQAVIYRRFLDHIEPSERPYHAGDPAAWLGRSAALARGAGG